MITGALEGQSLAENWEKLQLTYWDVLKTNYKVWPAIQLLNFYLVPMHYQSIVVNTVSVGWNAYLSHANKMAIDKLEHIHHQSAE